MDNDISRLSNTFRLLKNRTILQVPANIQLLISDFNNCSKETVASSPVVHLLAPSNTNFQMDIKERNNVSFACDESSINESEYIR
eukprot:m.213494 g.213494  ORF g.213494 m.213494 type:complete len:85 (+) comp39788_c1_seq11:252-506(+)